MVHEGDCAIQVPAQWQALPEQFQVGSGRIIIVGSGDSGKTTLARWLCHRLGEDATAAWVDADVGQSQVGPPATVGWRMADSEQCHCYFVGDVSPAGRAAPALSALVRAVRDAEQAGAQYTVIDTTGFVEGREAVALKTAKVELLAPATVLLVGDDKPLRRLRRCWQNFSAVRLISLNVAEEVADKRVADRREHRRRKFAAALAGAETWWLSPESKALVSSGADFAGGLPKGLLLGFADDQHRMICLGLLQAVDMEGRRLLVHAPVAAETAPVIMLGAVALSPSGEQLDTRRR